MFKPTVTDLLLIGLAI